MRSLNDWQVHFRLQFDLTVAADASLAAAASSSSSSLLGPAGGASASSPSSGQFWSAHLWPQGVTYDALPVTARVRVHRSCALYSGDSLTFATRYLVAAPDVLLEPRSMSIYTYILAGSAALRPRVLPPRPCRLGRMAAPCARPVPIRIGGGRRY